jgi:Putative phage serine protease XkdF
MAQESRFVLGLAYQAGRDPRIKKGQDGGRDYFEPEELEKAAWSFLRGRQPKAGLFHAPGTLGHIDITESYIYRGPDWDVGNGLIVKAGDWVVGGILDEPTWALYKQGRITGWSPQGTGRRVNPRSE